MRACFHAAPPGRLASWKAKGRRGLWGPLEKVKRLLSTLAERPRGGLSFCVDDKGTMTLWEPCGGVLVEGGTMSHSIRVCEGEAAGEPVGEAGIPKAWGDYLVLAVARARFGARDWTVLVLYAHGMPRRVRFHVGEGWLDLHKYIGGRVYALRLEDEEKRVEAELYTAWGLPDLWG